MKRNPPSETEMGRSVREIFTVALACSDPAERSALLDAECGANAGLRARVDALLEETSRVGDFLEEPAIRDESRAEGQRTAPTQKPGEKPGDHIGPYELLELVGEGGGGSVYRARQRIPVQRMVALKILKLGMDTKNVIRRFATERQALAVMDHPNIARVLDAGASPDGRPYFVMDFVRGEPLTDYCDAHALTLDERIAIFIKVCRAVEHAHQKGIIHRDLKPSNILVTDQDGRAMPKVIDFGVAKAIDPLEDDPSVTQIETVIGTPAYMSPEQAERDRVDVDTRSDVYSLGVLLYELLTSYTPLDARKVRQAGIEDLRSAFRTAEPYQPSLRIRGSRVEDRPKISIDRGTTLEKLEARVRGDLDGIVMKCLERDRTRRYGSASELASDLECFLRGLPVTARPPRAADRVGKFVRRHRAVVAACAVFLLILIAGAVISTGLAVRAIRAERIQSQLRIAADRGREDALHSAATARLHEYVADINVGHHALLDGNIAKALAVLERQTLPKPGVKDLRGFEWRFLAAQCLGDPHRSFPRQEGPILALSFSRDGGYLAVGSREDLLVWDLVADAPLRSLPGGATALEFFPDGGRLVASNRQGVWVYDLDTGEVEIELGDQGGALALSQDGSLMATADRRGVTVWDTVSWNRWRHFPGASGPLAFSASGELLASSFAEAISLWSLAGEGSRVVLEDSSAPFRGMFPGGRRIAFSPNGAQVIIPHVERSTRGVFYLGIWDSKSGKEIDLLPDTSLDHGHSGIISALAHSRAGSLLATSSWDHSVRLWDLESRRVLRTLHAHRGEVWAVALSPRGDLVASGSKDGVVKIWPTEAAEPRESIAGRWVPLGFSKDSRYAGAFNREGSLAIFNLNTREQTYSMELTSSDSSFRRHVVSLGGDLSMMAEGLADGMVRVRDLDDNTEMLLQASERRIDFVGLAPDASTLVTIGWRDDLAWWDLTDPDEPITRISASHAVFSADGSTLATFSREGYGTIWDAASRTVRARIMQGGQSFGSSIALSPNGKVVAMSFGFDDFENAVSLLDAETGARLGTLTGHKQAIWSLAFSPDGRTLATSSADGTLRLWSVATRRELLAIDEAGTNLTNLRFSPDGYYLIGGSPSFSNPGELRIIHAPPVEFNDEGSPEIP